MYVAIDKPTAVKMHNLILHYWPEYLKELKGRIDNAEDEQQAQELRRKYAKVEETEVCVVVSSEQNEVDKFRKMDLDIETHRKKISERDLEKEFKNEDNPFRLAIVCAMWITGFDAPCVSTVYLDKPIKGHTLMQTIARANRVYDDEKENGLIVDYGNVHKQLEKAYSIYGEGKKGEETGTETQGKTVEELIELELEIKTAIKEVRSYLKSIHFNLSDLFNAKPMEKIGKLKEAADCICLNETTRSSFEIMSRNVFRKYKALFPEPEAKPFTKEFNAIEAIYNLLNQNVKSADVIEIMMDLQAIVDRSIKVIPNDLNDEDPVYVDLGNLDFDKLRAAFAKAPRKNTIVYDLQEAIEEKLQQMLRENPLRLDFHDRYRKIVSEYNKGKSLEDTMKSFDNLTEFFRDLSIEDQRALKENLGNQEVLAIFDLLVQGKELEGKELKSVKKVAVETLANLKEELLNIKLWRESRQARAKVKIMIDNKLLWLPEEAYNDEEVDEKSLNVYQHIYSNYFGDGKSVYNQSA